MTLDFLDCMSEKSKMLNVDRWYNDGYGNKKWFLKVLWVGTAVSFKNQAAYDEQFSNGFIHLSFK